MATPATRQARLTSDFQRVATTLGALSLALAIIAEILVPVGPLTVALALIATGCLALDRRLGPLPAALIVVLAIPYDRAANIDLPRIADIPVRPQDAAVVLAVAMALLQAFAGRWSMPRGWRIVAVPVGLFLVVGVVATVVGVLEGNAMRDILRDGRWWALYGIALLALVTRVEPIAILRGLLVGATIFAVVAIVAAILPAFAGGLKDRALVFDGGLLRMQFGNSTFLMPALAYAVVHAVRTGRPAYWAWVTLIVVAIVLSLTRTFIVVSGGVLVLAVLLALGSRDRLPSPGKVVRVLAATGVTAVLGIALALGLNAFGNTTTANRVSIDLFGRQTGPGIAVRPNEDALDRLLLQSPLSDIGSLGRGRFETYGRAIDLIVANPVLGRGLGSLVVAEYHFGGEAFDTPGMLPNVDDAYLTFGMKAGLVGIVIAGLMLLLPLLVAIRRGRDEPGPWQSLRAWFIPGWLGILALTVTQSFATTGYGPFVLALLLVLPWLAYADRSAPLARLQE